MLEVRHMDAWHGRAQVLFDLNLQVMPGEWVMLRGLNGAGKSSLLEGLMGLGPSVRGEVRWKGQSMVGWTPSQRARAGLGWVAESRRIFTDLTVRENLWMGARPGPWGSCEQVQDWLLEGFAPLKPMLSRQANRMSGGEQQMLALARTLMGQPELLLLDEPCEGIAPVLVQTIRQVLQALSHRGTAMLVAEQGPVLASLAHRSLHLVSGRLTDASWPNPLH